MVSSFKDVKRIYVTATVGNKRVYVKTDNIRSALSVQQELIKNNFYNIRATKYKPRLRNDSPHSVIEDITKYFFED